MGLLPDECGMDQVWPLYIPVGRAFGPSCPAQPLSFGPQTGGGEELMVNTERFGCRFRTIPEQEVQFVPPDHLEMEPSVPTVVHQSALLGRPCSCFVYPHQVLRKYVAAFEFLPAGIFAPGEVDRRSRRPVFAPCFPALREEFRDGWSLRDFGGVFAGQGESAAVAGA